VREVSAVRSTLPMIPTTFTCATVAVLAVSAVALAACVARAAPAQAAETTATIAPSLTPDRLGAKSALTFAIQYTGGEFGVPAPVRSSILQFPAGLTLELHRLRGCNRARLRARGVSGCPAQSRLGGGHALVAVHAGSLRIAEQVTLSAFLGPPRNLLPTFEILARGYSPLDERIVFSGTVLPDSAPYGEELVLSIPPIPSLPLEPDASIVSFSLTIGARRQLKRHDADAVLVPSSCPATGGFPFAAEFTYADGAGDGALATVPCGRAVPATVGLADGSMPHDRPDDPVSAQVARRGR
jgi:hypothetical protein